jgi:uncharacterized protein
MGLDSGTNGTTAIAPETAQRVGIPPRFPAPRYEVTVEPDVMVPMRDGMRLATDLYVPRGTSGPLGTILIRDQYDKSHYAGEPLALAGQGFVVAVQDLRGLHRSEGRYSLARSDGPDGYDAVEWLARQPWSNGAVGTFGGSSLGITQLFLARERHPDHRCAIAIASGGALGAARGRHRYWEAWEGGAVKIGWLLKWFDNSGMIDRSAAVERTPEELERVLWSLPVAEMAARLGSPPTDWEAWVTRTPDDPAWREFGFLAEDDAIDLPTLFVNTWHDTCPGETIHEFELFRRQATSELVRDSQFLVLGPGMHCAGEILGDTATVGALEFTDVAAFDYWGTYLSWFEHWLGQERPDAPPPLPRVQYYAMGRNRWQSAPSWPVPGAAPTPWYLGSDGHANTRLGDGRLGLRAPESEEPADRFTYDPADPAPSVGGPELDGPADQAEVELRDDVLCYTSAELTEEVEVVGLVQAVLFVSSDAPDTDVTAKLVDVSPDGRAIMLCRGIQRARYREGFDRQVPLSPGEVARVEVSLQATGHVFLPGHRIRLEVSSSEFPAFARNLNTGTSNEETSDWRVAQNVVHHAPGHASYLELPVVTPDPAVG